MELLIAVVSVVIGALAGAIGTLLTTRSRVDLEQRAGFDRELRTLRVPPYQALHHTSEPLAREWRGDPPDSEQLTDLRERFHDWYFGPQAGGMFLTEAARTHYFQLMNQLQILAWELRDDQRASPQQLHTLLDTAHRLRQQLRADLGTAESPKLIWTARGLTPAPPSGPTADLRTPVRADRSVNTPGKNQDSSLEERGWRLWEDHHARQQFEHQLIDRKTTWLLVTQAILFAGYSATFAQPATPSGEQVRTVLAVAGLVLACLTLVGITAITTSKLRWWRDYRASFLTMPVLPPLGSNPLPWGARTTTTVISLVPDILQPMVFIGAWIWLLLEMR